jgi:hypothetical protein
MTCSLEKALPQALEKHVKIESEKASGDFILLTLLL